MYTIVNLSYEATGVCFLYMQKLYILYFLNFRISNDASFHSIFAFLQNFRTSFFIFKKDTPMNSY